jgi:hypothetical protein
VAPSTVERSASSTSNAAACVVQYQSRSRFVSSSRAIRQPHGSVLSILKFGPGTVFVIMGVLPRICGCAASGATRVPRPIRTISRDLETLTRGVVFDG